MNVFSYVTLHKLPIYVFHVRVIRRAQVFLDWNGNQSRHKDSLPRGGAGVPYHHFFNSDVQLSTTVIGEADGPLVSVGTLLMRNFFPSADTS